MAFTKPGKSTQNAFIERINGTYLREVQYYWSFSTLNGGAPGPSNWRTGGAAKVVAKKRLQLGFHDTIFKKYFQKIFLRKIKKYNFRCFFLS